MTPEERFERIERQLEFLATHQAQLTVSVGALREAAARQEGQIAQLTDVLVRLVRVVEDEGRRTDERISLLTEAQRRTDERIGLLTEAQRHTDERINSLISVVDRYFSDGRK